MGVFKFLWSKDKNHKHHSIREVPSCYRPVRKAFNNSTQPQYPLFFYYQLISHYVHSILSSRLLLDEDMTIVIRNYNSKAYEGIVSTNRTYLYYALPAFWAFAIYGEVQFCHRKPYYTLPFAMVSCMLQWKAAYFQKTRKRNIEEVLLGFAKLHKLNSEIGNYLKVRQILRFV